MMQSLETIILITYRPMCFGNYKTPSGELRQKDDGSWFDVEGNIYKEDEKFEEKRISIRQGINAINKNSCYKHRIWIIVDADVFPNEQYWRQFSNVEIIKCTRPYKVVKNYEDLNYRVSIAMQDALEQLPTATWVTYHWQADSIPSKNWDKEIKASILRNNMNITKVYAPMWIEGGKSQAPMFYDTEATPEFIWKDWNTKIPKPWLWFPYKKNQEYITQKNVDNYIENANKANKTDKIESITKRSITSCNVMVIHSDILRATKIPLVTSWDNLGIQFDGRLRVEHRVQRVAVVKSFIFHPCEVEPKLDFRHYN